LVSERSPRGGQSPHRDETTFRRMPCLRCRRRRPGASVLPVRRLPPLAGPSRRSHARTLLALSLGLISAVGCGGGKPANASDSGATAPGAAPANPAPAQAADTAAQASAPAAPGDLGAQVFAKRCALCHGAEGHGDGIAARGLNPKPRNFHDLAYMSTRTDAQL